jgi:lysophospholipase L1-like esterase
VSFDLSARAQERFETVPWGRYVAMGDSVTEGTGDPVDGYPTQSWANTLADALRSVRSDLEFFNLGERYLTTKQIRESQLERALELEPDLVTVVAGGNDTLIEKFDPRRTEAELEAMVTPLLEAGATVCTFTMFDIWTAGIMADELAKVLRPRFDQLADAVRNVAERHGLPLSDFAANPVSNDPAIYSEDRQHANMRGHAVAAELMLDLLAGVAAEQPAPQRR